jgi:DNA-binding transcriptional MerR regulator
MATVETEEFTIEQLAARAGMTVRNIRAHQTRGLVPSPTVRARTGYYGQDHLARLNLIRELQGAGFNLKAIRQLLNTVPEGAGEEVLRLERLLMAPWEEEEAEIIEATELAERFGGGAKVAKKAEELGLIVPMGDGRYEVPSPGLLRAGESVIAMGVPVEHALATMEKVRRHMRGVATEFVRLFLRDVWRPVARAGLPQDQLPHLRETLEKLRTAAVDVVRMSFQLSIGKAVEDAFEKELENLG